MQETSHISRPLQSVSMQDGPEPTLRYGWVQVADLPFLPGQMIELLWGPFQPRMGFLQEETRQTGPGQGPGQGTGLGAGQGSGQGTGQGAGQGSGRGSGQGGRTWAFPSLQSNFAAANFFCIFWRPDSTRLRQISTIQRRIKMYIINMCRMFPVCWCDVSQTNLFLINR